MADKIVQLSRHYEVPGQEPFDSVTLREPTYRDIFMSGLGVPRDVHWTEGKPLVVTYHDVIDQYLRVLIKGLDYSALSVLGTQDAMDLGEAVCDFFLKSKA